jgi:cysteine desulfurase
MIYFDNAATTPLDPEVYETMCRVMKDVCGNPSSVHSFGRESKVLVEEARIAIATYLKVNASEIYFTASATEAITTAFYGAVRDIGIRRIITSPIEHHAVLHAIDSLRKTYPIEVCFLTVDKNGYPDLEKLGELLEDGPKSLVILMHANNEIGCMNPVEKISNICKAQNALFLSDMVQTFGKYPNDLSLIKPDFTCCSAHKFHGPKGVGFLYIPGNIQISPLITGGGQERQMRSGTENTYGIVGMARAFDVAYRDMEKNTLYISGLKSYFVECLNSFFPGLIYHAGSDHQGLYNIISVAFPEPYKSEMLLQNLDIHGIAVSGGSACSSGAVGSSHVLSALNADTEGSTIRFSLSKFNTTDEIEQTIGVLKKILL